MEHWWSDADSTRSKPCPSATLLTANPIGLVLDPARFRGENLATNCPRHGTAQPLSNILSINVPTFPKQHFSFALLKRLTGRAQKCVRKRKKCMMWGGSALTSNLTFYQLQVDSPPSIRTPGPPFY